MKVISQRGTAPTIEGAEMLRPWLNNRVQPTRPKILSSHPPAALLMAATVASTMLRTITKLFAPKAPTADIAGVALIHDEAAQLMHTCTALKNALNLQLSLISQMLGKSKKGIVSQIRQIQTRHIDLHIHPTLMVSKTKSSTALWVQEFADAHAALERKVVAINWRSKELGWINVARQYWPIVAVTYGWFLPLIIRLQSELRQALKRKELWTAGSGVERMDEDEERDQRELAVLYMTYQRVHLGREATAREYQIGSDIKEPSAGKL
ncbi:hypothetical protein N0V86_001847 [Didymella sp. IMI 355093]|nr:hypothetical protein N0V86_001847 [Didymella sp. IMI 355093]